MTHLRYGLAAMSILALASTACGGNGQSEPSDVSTTPDIQGGTTQSEAQDESPEARSEPWKVSFGGATLPSMTGLLTEVIASEGLAEQYGIDLNVRKADAGAAEQALVTGQFDVGFLPLLTMARVQEEGLSLRYLMPLQATHASVIVPADSPAQTLEDLKGETIGNLGPSSGMSTSMEILTTHMEGVTWPADFEPVQGPSAALVAYLQQGETAAIMHFEPFVTRLIATGDYREVLSQNAAYRDATGSDLILSGIAAKQEWIDEDPERATAVIDMFRAAMQRIQDGGPSLLEPYSEDLQLSGDALEKGYESMAPLYASNPPQAYEDGANSILTSAKELGLIEGYETPIFWDGYASTN